MFDHQTFDVKSKSKSAPKVEFSVLVENGFLQPGQKLFFSKDKSRFATIKPDAQLRTADGFEGSIHKAGSHYMKGSPCNGWEHWYLQENGGLISLGDVREKYRLEKGLYDE
jgi:modification methylase